jgi:hypothetical protein
MTSPILMVGLVTETSHDSGMHDLSAAFPADYRLPGGPIGQSAILMAVGMDGKR